jgi:hypothetical protein
LREGNAAYGDPEGIARTRNCVGAWVDAYTFQSAPGYRIFGTPSSYPEAEQRIFLMKIL